MGNQAVITWQSRGNQAVIKGAIEGQSSRGAIMRRGTCSTTVVPMGVITG